MNNQKQITEKQNDAKLLDCQYASRVLFNRAEKYSYLATACIILSTLCIFITGEKTSIIIPTILDILLIVFGVFMNKSQSKAAELRQYFDAVVLGINEHNYSDAELCNIYSTVFAITTKNSSEHAIQVKNSGRDFPPGVKNWYEFSKEFHDNGAVFECQKQNCWWNDKLCKCRLKLTTAAFVFSLFLYGIAIHLLQINLFQAVFCLIGLLIGLAEQIYENCKYILLSKTMDDVIKIPDVSKNVSQLEHLQTLINRRRELMVLEINWMHRKNSKIWSEEYEKISRH